MTEVFTAKTVDEAKAMAVRKFGKKAGEIKFEVLEEGKKGFFGIGQTDAKVRATYVAAVPKPEVKKEAPKTEEAPKKVEVKAVSKSEEAPKKVEVKAVSKSEEAPKKVEVKAVPKSEEAPKKVEVKTVSKSEEAPKKVEVKAVSKSEEAAEIKEVPANEEEKDFSLEEFTLIEDEALVNPKVKIARDYITSILNAMNVDASFKVYQNETGAVINIESNNNGTIIGRRGETLDSIQYLCSIIANKGDKDYFRITIDCLGYRSKRKETLEQLAAKVARTVIRTGRSQQLEPMNPYERRVIHSAVSEIEGVSSRSVGEEPYRKIIISSTNPKNNRGGRGGRGSRRDDRRGGRQGGNDRRRDNYEPKAMDFSTGLSTSFEKDYKKPKPEDSMEGGLYGKIEL
ncbi:MAG: Jag N-terminal domain-containing protein [Ruminococcus sp.]|nr:Jag N-terminal domain-containing protein [Ruminococcus sp.]